MFNTDVQIESRPPHISSDAPYEPVHWNGIFTGLRYQCVELARRYLLQTYGLVFARIDNAYEIFDLPELKGPLTGSTVAWPSHTNEGFTPSACHVGSLIIWAASGFYEPTGHVAVVSDASPTYVEIVEQNEETTRRQLPIVDGRIYCTHTDTTILGWKVPPQLGPT